MYLKLYPKAHLNKALTGKLARLIQVKRMF